MTRQEKTMELGEIIACTKEQLLVLHPLPVSGVIGATKRDDGWHVIVELIERKGIPDAQDLLGVYEAVLDEGGSMISYQRRKVRRRSDTMEEAES
ncbi:MAG TPA: gas vesicle protein GvpO [Candidatus Binatia bacterium]|nr:gas vesicle protein GvpO [Candidatus Binatia bacterium]